MPETFVRPDFPGTVWGHEPETHGDDVRAGQRPVFPGRAVLHFLDERGEPITWAHTPEACPVETSSWHLDGHALLCNGCGLDGT